MVTNSKYLLNRLSDRISRATPPHPLRVGIDGPDGAGKTVLADELS
jgi:uridine kinase